MGMKGRSGRGIVPGWWLVAMLMLLPAPGGAADCLAFGSIGPNQTINASLDGSECVIEDIIPSLEDDKSYYDLYRLDLPHGAHLRVTMNSRAIDAVVALWKGVFLKDPGNLANLIVWNDDANDSTLNAEINASVGPGTYIVMANSAWNRETGAYTLRTISNVGELPRKRVPLPWLHLFLE